MTNNTSKRFYVDTSLGQMHGQIYPNKGQTIVCLHPMPYSGRYYETFCKTLTETTSFSSLCLDMIGYGQSASINNPISIQDYARSVIEALDQLISDKFINKDISLLGFHTGSAIANEIAVMEPKMINKLIFVTYPYFEASDRKERLDSIGKIVLDENIESLRSMWDFSVANRAEGVLLDRALSNFTDQLQSTTKGWFGFDSMFNYPSEERLLLQKKPTLILNDQSSLTEPTSQANEVIQDSYYVELENTKGAIFELNTDQIIHHISEFLLT